MYSVRNNMNMIDLTGNDSPPKPSNAVKTRKRKPVESVNGSPVVKRKKKSEDTIETDKVVKARKRKPVESPSGSPVVKKKKAAAALKKPRQVKKTTKASTTPKSKKIDKVNSNNLLIANCSLISDSEDERCEVANINTGNLDSNDDGSRMSPLDNNTEYPLLDVGSVLSEETGVSQTVANNIINLIEDDNTLPFIARYRKTMVDFMSPERLQEIFDSYQRVCKVKRKSLSILHTLKKTNKLTEEIQNSIISARSIAELDLVYEPLKTLNTMTSRIKKFGLEESIKSILGGNEVSFSSLCNSDLKTPEEVQTHLIHGLANAIYKDPSVLELIRNLKDKSHIMVECQKARKTKNDEAETSLKKNKHNNTDDNNKYDLYIGFKMKAELVKPHQILAINRGEAMKALSVKIVVTDWFLREFIKFCTNKWKIHLIVEVANEAYKKYIHPWICRNVRSEMTARAVKESVKVFCLNLKRLLLTTPIKGHNILGIDPGFKAGCKIAIIGATGVPLETFVLHPKFTDKYDNEGRKLLHCIKKHNCEIIALGNGTASRETENWLRNLGISENQIVIVPEQGASIYSCSPEAAKEFPGMDPNLISAISLARRVLDPLSELVKVNAKHIGVGMYQHDIKEKILAEALENIVVYCVSFVGVDLNTASHTLLGKIAGLTAKKVKSIIEYREKIDGFKSRDELMKVTGIGPKTFTQCAGFLRVPNSKVKLDNTWIHPESYDLAYKLIKNLYMEPSEIGTLNFIKRLEFNLTKTDLSRISANLKCTKSDIDLIIEALTQLPSQEVIRNIKPIYSMSVNNVKDLVEGVTITGVVNNVTSFGVFVDCGVGKNGLIHNSKFGDCEPPQLGDKVMVTVINPVTENKLPLKLIKIIN